MKRFFAGLFVFFICICVSGLGKAQDKRALSVLASTFPVYLFTQNVCENARNVQVELLIPASAGCPHDFALKPADLKKLENADVLVINGHDLEEFLEKIIDKPREGLKIIIAGEGIETLPAAVSSHGHEHGNPHIFAAPAEAAEMVFNIGRNLAVLDSSNAETYTKNTAYYSEKLKKLSEDFIALGKRVKNKNVVIAHDGLAYLMNNAGLNVAAILENNVSLARVTALKKQLQKENPALVIGETQYPDRFPETLAKELGVPYVTLDTCASGPANAPPDFYALEMSENLKILEKYLE